MLDSTQQEVKTKAELKKSKDTEPFCNNYKVFSFLFLTPGIQDLSQRMSWSQAKETDFREQTKQNRVYKNSLENLPDN